MKWGHRKLLATNAISRSSRGLIDPSQSCPLMAVVVRFRWCVFFSLLFRRLPAVTTVGICGAPRSTKRTQEGYKLSNSVPYRSAADIIWMGNKIQQANNEN